MCGISGWIDFQRDLTREQPVVDAMCETMACRGPDSAGTWVRPHASLGHRRLAIIDLPGGAQPMPLDGTIAMVYSGEAYNYAELRDELRRRGHRFATDSDTEVVLHGYLEWGGAVAEHLNGMYACAVWDSRDDKLLLIRDRMGIKPLYYYPTGSGVLFGSEPKAIPAHPLAEAAVDADGLRELFVMTKAPGHGIWAGTHEVEPGTVVTVDRKGLRQRTYWRLAAVEHTDDQRTTVEHVRELLDDIVARQLVADVPRCLLLSGGLDSSALTALAGRQLAPQGETVRSFAVDFLGQAENFVPGPLRATPRRALRARGGRARRHRAPGHRAGPEDARRPRGAPPGDARPRPPRFRRDGQLAVPAVQGDSRPFHRGALRRVRRRGLRWLQVVPRPAGAAGADLPLDRRLRGPGG